MPMLAAVHQRVDAADGVSSLQQLGDERVQWAIESQCSDSRQEGFRPLETGKPTDQAPST
jgi:hypothetical protein